MNYLELINKTLVELNYKQVSSFADLTKNDHKKIKNILNVLNAEVCGFDKWHFLLRTKELPLPANTTEIENTINGRISNIYADNAELHFTPDFDKFITGKQSSDAYSVFNNKLLLPKFDKNKTLKIIYYTNNYAIDEDGTEKASFVEDTDTSQIPQPFVEPLLVYGTCMRLKGNPKHIRFNYWYSMYKDALANLRSKISVNIDESPSVKLYRR